MQKVKSNKKTKVTNPNNIAGTATEEKKKPALRVPVLPLFFVAVLAWAAFYYGSVFHLSREYSFWVSDTRQLDFILSCSFGSLR